MADRHRSQSNKSHDRDVFLAIRGPLRLTWAGLFCERLVRCFWPMWVIVLLALTALMFGLHDTLPVQAIWALGALIALAALSALGWGLWTFKWPRRSEVQGQLDASLGGNPLQTVLDTPAVGAGDAASEQIWAAHRARQMDKLAKAKAPKPDLTATRYDPYALRYVALVAAFMGLAFGSILRVQSLGDMAPGQSFDLAGGPSWEGWAEPPAYTGLPVIYMPDINANRIELPEGTKFTFRFYGEIGALTLREDVSGKTHQIQNPDTQPEPKAEMGFDLSDPGTITIDGKMGRSWTIAMLTDQPPIVALDGPAETTVDGIMSLPFVASDDYAVISGSARFTLALDEVDRSFGRALSPEPYPALEADLPMPISGDRSDFVETLKDDFAQHAWANLPVKLEMTVVDEAGQSSETFLEILPLPGRSFFDPMAAAIIEQRQMLLWNRDNAKDVVRIMRALSHLPETAFRNSGAYLRFRGILRNLDSKRKNGLSAEARDELAGALWSLAIVLEEGDLDDARERLRRAQDRLDEAIRNGASDEEIADLMRELREATDDYMRQLAQENRRQAEQNADSNQSQQGNTLELSQNDLQAMMDRIQELMEQGRMAEAQEAMDQLRQMMENMQVTEGGQSGQGQSPGEQALDQLGDALREQQELSDEAFRDLQNEYNFGQPPGGDQGEQQPGQQQGQGSGGDRQQGQSPNGEATQEGLTERQKTLRRELERQRNGLPNQGTEGGRQAGEALKRAEDAMEGAESALREGDLRGAIGQQADAMEALREGMRALGEALAQQRQQQGQQGEGQGQTQGQARDPLGRDAGSSESFGTDEGMLGGADVYRRAEELLDEIRRRSGEQDRPQEELDYLKRLLDRF